MFGLSAEHLIIVAVILLIFGPKKIPQLGATLGKTFRNFKEQTNGIVEPSYRTLSETIDPIKQSVRDAVKESVMGKPTRSDQDPAGPTHS